MEFQQRLLKKREDFRLSIRKQAYAKRASRKRDNLILLNIDSFQQWTNQVQQSRKIVQEVLSQYIMPENALATLESARNRIQGLLASQRFGQVTESMGQSLVSTLIKLLKCPPEFGKLALQPLVLLTGNSSFKYLRCYKLILQPALKYWNYTNDPEVCIQVCCLFGNMVVLDRTLSTLSACFDAGVFKTLESVILCPIAEDVLENCVWFLSRALERDNKNGRIDQQLQALSEWFRELVLDRIRKGDRKYLFEYLIYVDFKNLQLPVDICAILDGLNVQDKKTMSLLVDITSKTTYTLPEPNIEALVRSLYDCEQENHISTALNILYNNCLNDSRSCRVVAQKLARAVFDMPLVSILYERLSEPFMPLMDLVSLLMQVLDYNDCYVQVCVDACIGNPSLQATIQSLGYTIDYA